MDAANFLVDICKLICLDVDYRPGDGSAEDGGGSAKGCVHSRVDIMKFGSKRFYIRGSVARADPSILACRVARALKSSGITPGLKVTLFIPTSSSPFGEPFHVRPVLRIMNPDAVEV